MKKTEKDKLFALVEKHSEIVMKLINQMATLNSSISNMNFCISVLDARTTKLDARTAKLESMQTPINDSLESDRESCSKLNGENIKKNS